MKKTIVVAGGAGFIGSHLCKFLLDKGNSIICIDNLVTGNKNNINSMILNDNFILVKGDTSDSRIEKLLPKVKIDEVYDLASPASVTYIVDHPVEVAVVNSLGTKNLLDLCRKNKAKFLYASSSESYGNPKEHPQKEAYWGNVNPVGVRSGYDEGKRFGEALCMAYHRELGVDVKIIRIFNTYGSNSSPQDSRVIPRFVTQAIANKPLTVHGDGQQTRSFCYVSDLVDGIVKMMMSSDSGPINLGNPVEYKVIDLATKIIQMTGSKSKIIFVDRPEDDPNVRKPDISLAKNKLSWEPGISLDQGLRMTIDYFRKILL